MNVLALDIGGANLKASDGDSFAVHCPFPLWRDPQGLSGALREIITQAPESDLLAVTMTGELADCYRTKAEGVREILSALQKAAENRKTLVYLTDGRMSDPSEAMAQPLLAAASNWHVLARYAGHFADDACGLLIDIGSTTTDLIPICEGRPIAIGKTDPERLAASELVYTGVERSPVCGILDALPWRGAPCPVAQELFATSGDAYLMLEELWESSDTSWTADGRAASREFAQERLARAICADRQLFSKDDALAAAKAIRNSQVRKLHEAAAMVLTRISGSVSTIVISGRGEFLANRLIRKLEHRGRVVSLAERLGPVASRVATAHALAVLVREEIGG